MMTRRSRILGTTLGTLIGLVFGLALLAARDHVVALGQSPAVEDASAETEKLALCRATDPLPAATETATPAEPRVPAPGATATPEPRRTAESLMREPPTPMPWLRAEPLVSPTIEPVVALRVDVDPTTPGIQTERTVTGGTFTVDIVISGLSDGADLGVFAFDLVYDQRVLRAPTIGAPASDLDRNPDANQGFLNSTGLDFDCGALAPSGDRNRDPAIGEAFISCRTLPDAPRLVGEGVLSTVTFEVVGAGATDLTWQNVVFGNAYAVEIGSCNPTVQAPAACEGATITVVAP